MDGAGRLGADRRVELERLAERTLGDVNDHVGAHGEPVGVVVEHRDRANELAAPVGVALDRRQDREARRDGRVHNRIGPTVEMLHSPGLSGDFRLRRAVSHQRASQRSRRLPPPHPPPAKILVGPT